MAGPVATGLCARAALWAVDVGQTGRLGQAEADLVDQSAVVAVDPVDPAVVAVDPVDQPQAQARQSQTEDLS
jgi:hypothetical protein